MTISAAPAFDIARTQSTTSLSGFLPTPIFDIGGGNAATIDEIELQEKTWYAAHLTITSNGLKFPTTLRFNNFMTADDLDRKSNGFFSSQSVRAIYDWCQATIGNAAELDEKYVPYRRERTPA